MAPLQPNLRHWIHCDCGRELPAIAAEDVGGTQIASGGLASLSLSTDERVLAIATSDGGISLYGVRALVDASMPPQPLATWQLLEGDAAVQVRLLCSTSSSSTPQALHACWGCRVCVGASGVIEHV